MKIGVIGTGYVGLVTGACLAKMGFEVHCIDNDARKVAMISNGESPIYEPGLSEILKSVLESGRFKCDDDIAQMAHESDLMFICVGTPMDDAGQANLSYVMECANSIKVNMHPSRFQVVCVKSTVPPGTTAKVERILAEANSRESFGMSMCPEFLKEGTAVSDFMIPDRIVAGVDSPKTKAVITRVFEQFVKNDHPLIITNVISAEVTKYAANCMLAARISLINEFSRICDSVGANINDVRRGIATDTRIGSKFLYAGPGYGGSCFPKDVQAISYLCGKNDVQEHILTAIQKSNETQKEYFAEKVLKEVESSDLIAIWGLAFKANTDDMRDASSITLVKKLKERTCIAVRAYDPQSMENAEEMKAFDEVTFGFQYEVVKKARVLVIVTEWDVFRFVDFKALKGLMAENPVIIDGRNLYNREEVESHGFKYVGIGR